MRKIFSLSLFTFFSCFAGYVQPVTKAEIRILVLETSQLAITDATVSLLKKDSSVVSTVVTGKDGVALFNTVLPGHYLCRVSRLGYKVEITAIDLQHGSNPSVTIIMKQEVGLLQDVTVTAKKPFVQHFADKTVVNVDASITNTGSTILEVLEKSPGVTVDKNGNISLKGRPGVQIMLDGKLTQLSGTDLQNLLAGMSASQVELIELIDNPSAKYDAAGNAGIINIKTKKNKQKGFNGNAGLSYIQGRLPKTNSSLVFNYRNGAVNFFLTYSINIGRNFMDLYALRTYYTPDRSNITSLLEQPNRTKFSGTTHTIRTGVDYFLDKKTTVGFVLTGMTLDRTNNGNSTALWKDKTGVVDSSIMTNSANGSNMKQGGLNFNARHAFNASTEWTADLDLIGYDIKGQQFFENKLLSPGADAEATRGSIPSSITIFSAKTDYSKKMGGIMFEAGGKTSRVSTDNLAQYYYLESNQWKDDYGKSNHFLYTENIHAIYSSVDSKTGRWGLQGGLRYEYTGYRANQLGNVMNKDSAFNRNYQSLFPTVFITYKVDSSNSFTLRGGRRIDRPAFQKLNPFVIIINKYTYQTGNPFFKPQYTWNIELNHLYKEVLSTGINYSLIKDYISQVFYSDTSTGRIVYTEGNIGRMQNLGLTTSIQVSPASWWSLYAQATFNHKRIEGVLWKKYKASISQLNMNINNQFRFAKGWAAELSGFYITKNQNDIQEVLDPTGQLSVGFSKQAMKNKATIRLSFRDILYTQAMQGLTHFETVDEFFSLKRDTRLVALSINYRFGKAIKSPAKRQTGGAADEINRVNTN